MPSDSLSQLQTGAHARATNGGAAVSWQRMTHAVKLIDRDLTLLCVQRLLTIDQPLQLLLSGNRALRIASSKPSSRDAAMQQRCSWVVAMAAAWVLVAMQLAAPIAAAPTAAATGPAVESSYSIVRIGMSHQYFHVPAADAGHVWFDLLRLARLPAASLLPARRARHCGDLRLPPVLPVPAVRRLHSRSRAATCARTLAAGTLTTRSPGPPARLSRAAVSSECWQHELCLLGFRLPSGQAGERHAIDGVGPLAIPSRALDTNNHCLLHSRSRVSRLFIDGACSTYRNNYQDWNCSGGPHGIAVHGSNASCDAVLRASFNVIVHWWTVVRPNAPGQSEGWGIFRKRARDERSLEDLAGMRVQCLCWRDFPGHACVGVQTLLLPGAASACPAAGAGRCTRRTAVCRRSGCTNPKCSASGLPMRSTLPCRDDIL